MCNRLSYLLPTVIAASLPHLCIAQGRVSSLPAILHQIESRERRIECFEASFTRSSTMEPSFAETIKYPKDLGLRSVVDAIWAFKGPKYYYRETATTIPELQNQRQKSDSGNCRETTTIYDGASEHAGDSALRRNGTRYHYDTILAKPRTHFMSPLDFGWLVNGKWISEILRNNHSADVTGEETDKKFGRLTVVSCDLDNRVHARMWIAPECDYSAVRTELVSHWPGSNDTTTIDTYTCSKVELVNGLRLPTSGVFESCKRVGAQDKIQVTISLTDAKCHVNDVPDSLFVANVPPGSVIFNQAAGTRTEIGVHGEKVLDEVYSTISRELPLRWLFLVTITTLLALTMSVLAKWRPRSAR